MRECTFADELEKEHSLGADEQNNNMQYAITRFLQSQPDRKQGISPFSTRNQDQSLYEQTEQESAVICNSYFFEGQDAGSPAPVN